MAKSEPSNCSLSDLHKIRNKEQAKRFIEAYLKVFDTEQPKMPIEERVRIIRSNIGYCSGYYDGKTARRILRLFDTSHPVFGKDRPSAEDAFNAGVKMGQAMRKKKGE